MPYNTTAIPPRKEATGQMALPLARVKKILAQDPDINQCSNNAAFVITIATEMFIQHLANEAQGMAKLDRKPRRNVQYKDMASAVAHHDNLEFLEDIIPKTVPYKKIKNQAAAARAQGQNGSEDKPLPGQQAATGSKSGGASGGSGSGGKKQAKIGEAVTNGGGSGKKRSSSSGVNGVNGAGSAGKGKSGSGSATAAAAADATTAGEASDDPNAQLEAEMMQAAASGSTRRDRDGDVDMAG